MPGASYFYSFVRTTQPLSRRRFVHTCVDCESVLLLCAVYDPPQAVFLSRGCMNNTHSWWFQILYAQPGAVKQFI